MSRVHFTLGGGMGRSPRKPPTSPRVSPRRASFTSVSRELLRSRAIRTVAMVATNPRMSEMYCASDTYPILPSPM